MDTFPFIVSGGRQDPFWRIDSLRTLFPNQYRPAYKVSFSFSAIGPDERDTALTS